MSRPRSVPAYRLHKQSGQAVVTLTDLRGRRRDVLLGKHGTRASKAEYARVLHEWEAMGRKLDAWNGKPRDLTVNELIEEYWVHALKYYRHADGSITQETANIKVSLRPLKYLHGGELATDYSPLRLKAVRELMIKGYDHPEFGKQKALSRKGINHRIGRIKAMFRWAVENELLPATVHHGLCAVQGLRHGRSEARETEPVKPVPVPIVMLTVEKASPMIGDMIQLQLLTGMRSGELVRIRAIDIDMSGPVWIYKPTSHKTAHHGHSKMITIGPKGQEIIRRYLRSQIEAYLFSPTEATIELNNRKRMHRKSKVQPSQVCRKKAKPRKTPGVRYCRESYARAVTRAAELAGVPHWFPHQLRHTRATEIRKQFGIDAARAVLGHRSPAITEVYAELDLGQAAAIMSKIG